MSTTRNPLPEQSQWISSTKFWG